MQFEDISVLLQYGNPSTDIRLKLDLRNKIRVIWIYVYAYICNCEYASLYMCVYVYMCVLHCYILQNMITQKPFPT